MANPSKRDYVPASVGAFKYTQAKVTKSFTALTVGELTKLLGRPPRAKDPKLQTADVNGELFYIFRDAEHPWRRLELSYAHGESRDTTLMHADQHMHRGQADATWEACKSRRSLDSSTNTLLTARVMGEMATVDEYMQKLSDVKVEASLDGASKRPAPTSLEPEVQVVENEDAEQEPGAASTPATLPSSVASFLAVGSGQGIKDKKKTKPAGATLSSSASQAGALQRSGSAARLPEQSENGSDGGTEAEVQKKGASTVVKEWQDKLQLPVIFMGQKKGVVFRHAEAKAKKLEPAYADMLLNHVQERRCSAGLGSHGQVY